jgi:hypothetical protein
MRSIQEPNFGHLISHLPQLINARKVNKETECWKGTQECFIDQLLSHQLTIHLETFQQISSQSCHQGHRFHCWRLFQTPNNGNYLQIHCPEPSWNVFSEDENMHVPNPTKTRRIQKAGSLTLAITLKLQSKNWSPLTYILILFLFYALIQK